VHFTNDSKTKQDEEIRTMTTISSTADQAADRVKDGASHVRGTLLELSTQVIKLINSAREAEGRGMDTVLHRLGLERRRSALGPVLWFTAGAVAAGTVVLLTAPTSGKGIRRAIASFFDHEVDEVGSQAGAAGRRVEEVVNREVETAKTAPANGAKRELG